jgi:hypothetical protein
VDFDGDGILDMISGSYDPGDLYLFRGLGQGKYAARETLLDESGVPLVHHPDELVKYQSIVEASGEKYPSSNEAIQARVASFGSWPATVDWDGDGDLDVLIGTFSGDLFLRINEGSRKLPRYSGESIQVRVDGKALHVEGHANPVIADWDGDGLWDLVVSASNGSVWWSRNSGTEGEPALGQYRLLIESRSDNKLPREQYLKPGETPEPGVRAQICVLDYNGDGRLDLLMGDYASAFVKRGDLGADEEAELLDVLERERNLPRDASAEQREEVNLAKSRFLSPRSTHSFVWLYLRKPEETPPLEVLDMTGEAPTWPVAVEVGLAGQKPGGEVELLVTLTISPGWHIYADVPEGSPYPASRIQLDLPEEMKAVGEWRASPGLAFEGLPGTTVYEHSVTFARRLAVTQVPAELTVTAYVQACDANMVCLPPAALRRELYVRAAR